MESHLLEQARLNAARDQEIKSRQKEADRIARSIHGDCREILKQLGNNNTYQVRKNNLAVVTIQADALPPTRDKAAIVSVRAHGVDEKLLLSKYRPFAEIEFTDFREGGKYRAQRRANIFEALEYQRLIDDLDLPLNHQPTPDPKQVAELENLSSEALTRQLSRLKNLKPVTDVASVYLCLGGISGVFLVAVSTGSREAAFATLGLGLGGSYGSLFLGNRYKTKYYLIKTELDSRQTK